MTEEIELGRLYKAKYKSLNLGDYIYPISQYHGYTEQMKMVVVVRAIQMMDGWENRIIEIYSHRIKEYFDLVEDD